MIHRPSPPIIEYCGSYHGTDNVENLIMGVYNIKPIFTENKTVSLLFPKKLKVSDFIDYARNVVYSSNLFDDEYSDFETLVFAVTGQEHSHRTPDIYVPPQFHQCLIASEFGRAIEETDESMMRTFGHSNSFYLRRIIPPIIHDDDTSVWIEVDGPDFTARRDDLNWSVARTDEWDTPDERENNIIDDQEQTQDQEEDDLNRYHDLHHPENLEPAFDAEAQQQEQDIPIVTPQVACEICDTMRLTYRFYICQHVCCGSCYFNSRVNRIDTCPFCRSE
jgi:hypothetical protein